MSSTHLCEHSRCVTENEHVFVNYAKVGADLMIEGYLPSSGGLRSLHSSLTQSGSDFAHTKDKSAQPKPSVVTQFSRQERAPYVGFYKAWDKWGSLSNFSPHAIWMPDGSGPTGDVSTAGDPNVREWPSVEHYYQAQKFAGRRLQASSITCMLSIFIS